MKPRVVVTISGGVVTSIMKDHEIDVAIVDYDPGGLGETLLHNSEHFVGYIDETPPGVSDQTKIDGIFHALETKEKTL